MPSLFKTNILKKSLTSIGLHITWPRRLAKMKWICLGWEQWLHIHSSAVCFSRFRRSVPIFMKESSFKILRRFHDFKEARNMNDFGVTIYLPFNTLLCLRLNRSSFIPSKWFFFFRNALLEQSFFFSTRWKQNKTKEETKKVLLMHIFPLRSKSGVMWKTH